ncbi:ABC transporter permease [Paenibacillus sp. MMS20-IR301]|uniref:ABC transporter permease n=1 Tax=Paenibacillus sp. MMS20-IR301 TaxID=2895946 RepID=UPI0028E891EE|nr:ABC transporter permease [Paenibacillus sp. MMS20-IR301]WNS45548.1 ABC transporter permease [Paenibacillus sp. MMS20-IR301]
MRKFNQLVQNEWLKIAKKRSFIVPYVLLALLVLVITYIADTLESVTYTSAAEYTADMLQSTGIGQILAILVIVMTAGIVSREYSQGTIKFLLIRARSRTAILASKYVTVLLYMLSMILTSAVALFVFGIIFFGVSGGDTGISDILISLVYGTVYCTVYATIGFMLGILTKSTGVSIGAAIFLTTIDKMMISREFFKYFLFPNLNLAAYKDGGAPMPGMTLGFSIVVLGIYMLLFLISGFTVFRRRDVA